jgi:hypothetical protein
MAAAAHAQVTLTDPWVRATVPQQKATGACSCSIDGGTQDVQAWFQASSPVAGVVEIHEMVMDGDVMKMRHMPAVAWRSPRAGKAIEPQARWLPRHADGPQRPGQGWRRGAVSLVFEGKDGKKQTVEIKATARPLNTAAKTDASQGGHAGMKH